MEGGWEREWGKEGGREGGREGGTDVDGRVKEVDWIARGNALYTMWKKTNYLLL